MGVRESRRRVWDARYRLRHRARRATAARLWRLLNPDRARGYSRASKRRLWKFRRLITLTLKLESIMTAVEDLTAAELTVAGLKLLDTDTLRATFREGLPGLAGGMRTLGLILIELDSRGEHIAGDRRLLNLLRRVGRGELLAEAAVEEATRSRRKEPEAGPEPDAVPARPRKATPPVTMEAIVARAKRSEPSDLATLLAAMVKANPHPAEVRRLLLDLLAGL